MTAKTRAIPSLHRDSIFRLKNQDSARCLRRVTQPPHIAGPLAATKGQPLQHEKNILNNHFAPYSESHRFQSTPQ